MLDLAECRFCGCTDGAACKTPEGGSCFWADLVTCSECYRSLGGTDGPDVLLSPYEPEPFFDDHEEPWDDLP